MTRGGARGLRRLTVLVNKESFATKTRRQMKLEEKVRSCVRLPDEQLEVRSEKGSAREGGVEWRKQHSRSKDQST